jgi:hypothetical protein
MGQYCCHQSLVPRQSISVLCGLRLFQLAEAFAIILRQFKFPPQLLHTLSFGRQNKL